MNFSFLTSLEKQTDQCKSLEDQKEMKYLFFRLYGFFSIFNLLQRFAFANMQPFCWK